MDNTTHDNILGISVGDVFKAGKKLWYKVKKDKPKAAVSPDVAAAQKISDAGGYLTLTPEQKALIPVPEYIKAQAAQISAKTGGIASTEDLQAAQPLPATSGQLVAKLKTYLPYILGAIALGLVIYFIVRKK
jgi:hypothetical protein